MIRTTDWIQLASGRPFWPLEPAVEDIYIDDIAHGLACQCRYNGHIKDGLHYSVAEHSYLISYAVPPAFALWGLLHDAEEALGFPDVTRPVKIQLPEYKAFGSSVLYRVAQRFNLSWPEPDEVKDMDRRILFNERDTVLNPSVIPWTLQGEPIPDLKIQCWQPKVAKFMFLHRFKELYKEATANEQ